MRWDTIYSWRHDSNYCLRNIACNNGYNLQFDSPSEMCSKRSEPATLLGAHHLLRMEAQFRITAVVKCKSASETYRKAAPKPKLLNDLKAA